MTIGEKMERLAEQRAEEAREREKLKGIRNQIESLWNFGIADELIFEQLEKQYSMSKEKILKLISEES